MAEKSSGSSSVTLGIAAAVLIGATIITYKTISSRAEAAAQEVAKAQAQGLLDHYRRLRQYYTENVVTKVAATTASCGLHAASDHKGKADAIPLPATMVADLSALMGTQGMRLRLYSKLPFPNRKDRHLDEFAQRSVRELDSAPQTDSVEVVEGVLSVRVAMPDKMGEKCVGCHNSLPDSPKKDWKVGDVRGVLEAIVPIDDQMKGAQVLAGTVLKYLLITSAIILAVLWVTTRTRSKATVTSEAKATT